MCRLIWVTDGALYLCYKYQILMYCLKYFKMLCIFPLSLIFTLNFKLCWENILFLDCPSSCLFIRESLIPGSQDTLKAGLLDPSAGEWSSIQYNLSKRPLSKRPKIDFKTNYRLMQVKSILSTCIKLPFVFKTFVMSIFKWPLKTDFAV